MEERAAEPVVALLAAERQRALERALLDHRWIGRHRTRRYRQRDYRVRDGWKR
jgi:hypothetical protein